MKLQLVKREDRWDLYDTNGHKIASTLDGAGNKLSIKNCQAIELGYDLDELANFYSTMTVFINRDEIPTEKQIEDAEHISDIAFKAGFQKALELICNKKYSEKDVISMIEKSRETGLTAEYLILTRQQTEWDVEIEMICPHPQDTYRCGIQYGCDEDGCNHPDQTPRLDLENCLILKRI